MGHTYMYCSHRNRDVLEQACSHKPMICLVVETTVKVAVLEN